VELLARHFFSQFMQEIPALRGKRLSPSAIDVLKGYSFPGNVRELKNIVERAVYRDTSNEVTPEDIGMLPSAPPSAQVRPSSPPATTAAGAGFYQQVESYTPTHPGSPPRRRRQPGPGRQGLRLVVPPVPILPA
jgi:transcriptional regulator with GAF, ATPase, and Fis domain